MAENTRYTKEIPWLEKTEEKQNTKQKKKYQWAGDWPKGPNRTKNTTG